MLDGECFTSVKAGGKLVTRNGSGCIGRYFIFDSILELHPNCLKCRFYNNKHIKEFVAENVASDLNNYSIMTRIAEVEDVEKRHSQADELLCQLLEDHGYYATVSKFREMEKWYS